jgi:MFS family permease
MGIRRILTIMFCLSLMLNMTRPIAVLFAGGLGATTFEIGLLVALFSMFPTMLALHAGKSADMFGERLPILLGSLGIGLSMCLPYAYPGLPALYASQLLVGVAHLFAVVSLQNLVGRHAPENLREHHYGMFSTSVSLASVAGPVTGGFIAQHASFESVYLAAAAVSAVPCILAWTIPKDRPLKRASGVEATSSFGLLRSPLIRRAIISGALVLYSRDIFVAYFPLYAESYGISILLIGWILSLQGLSMVLVRVLLPKLTAGFGRDVVLIGSICGAGVAFALIPTTGSSILLGALACCMGIGLGCGQPLSMVEAYNASPKFRTGEVLGLRMTANRVSQFAAPLFFGVIGSSLGLGYIFLLSGGLLLGGGFLIRSAKP